MHGRGATIHRVNAVAFPVNDNIPISMAVASASWHAGVPRFLDDEVSGAGSAPRRKHGADGPTAITNALGRAWLALRTWSRRRSTRLALHALDDRMLRDIGLARCNIEQAVRQTRSPDPASRRSS